MWPKIEDYKNSIGAAKDVFRRFDQSQSYVLKALSKFKTGLTDRLPSFKKNPDVFGSPQMNGLFKNVNLEAVTNSIAVLEKFHEWTKSRTKRIPLKELLRLLASDKKLKFNIAKYNGIQFLPFKTTQYDRIEKAEWDLYYWVRFVEDACTREEKIERFKLFELVYMDALFLIENRDEDSSVADGEYFHYKTNSEVKLPVLEISLSEASRVYL